MVSMVSDSSAASVHPQLRMPISLSLLTALQDLLVAKALVSFISLLPIYHCEANHLHVIDLNSVESALD